MTDLQKIINFILAIKEYHLIFIIDKKISFYFSNEFKKLFDVVNHQLSDQFDSLIIEVEGGEELKTLDQFEKITHQIFEHGITKNAHLICIGGGSVSDFSGYVAATLFRGIKWSIIPTTLLSMVDASIGGKTAINTRHGKNLLGYYHFPQDIILASSLFLKTLPKSEFDSGKGEIVKYCFLSKDIFNSVLQNHPMDQIIKKCADFKHELVKRDPHDKHERLFLNLGHTLGHAIEHQYSLPHGICILLGISFILNFLNIEELKNSFSAILKSLNFNENDLNVFNLIKKDHIDDLINFIKMDKKRDQANLIKFVFLKAIGELYLHQVEIDQIKMFLHKNCTN